MGSFLQIFLIIVMIVLVALMFACLIYAIKGPRSSDRLLASNVICTIAVIFISVLSVFLGEAGIVDIAFIYTLLSCLSGIIACYVIAENYHKKHKKKEEK